MLAGPAAGDADVCRRSRWLPGWQHFNVARLLPPLPSFPLPVPSNLISGWAWPWRSVCMCVCVWVFCCPILIDTRVPAATMLPSDSDKAESAACDACYNENPLNQIMSFPPPPPPCPRVKLIYALGSLGSTKDGEGVTYLGHSLHSRFSQIPRR